LGPFLGSQGLLSLFSNSPSPAPYPHNFSDVSTLVLTSFFTGLRLLIIIETPDGGVLTTCCRILSLLCKQIYQFPRLRLLTTQVFQHSFPILYLKIFFNNFWALFGAPGALAHYFRIPLPRYACPYFFRRFDLISHSFFRGLRLLMIIEPPDGGLLTTCCRILSLLYNQIYQSTRRHLLTTYGFHHTHFLYIFQKIFQNFLDPFWGPQSILPSIFEFPFLRYVSPYFFRPLFYSLLLGIKTPDDY